MRQPMTAVVVVLLLGAALVGVEVMGLAVLKIVLVLTSLAVFVLGFAVGAVFCALLGVSFVGWEIEIKLREKHESRSIS